MNKFETRNPKSEGMTKSEDRMEVWAPLRPSGFVIRISFGFRHSAFGFYYVTSACACASNTLAVL